MNDALVENFNSIVKPTDEVYILGDLMLGGSTLHQQGLDLISSLNGHLHLVRGNHDTDLRWAAYGELDNVVERENSIYLTYKKYHFYLSHFPSMTSNYSDGKSLRSRTINLCGHSHTKDVWLHWETGSYHCEVDAHDNKPINIEEIIEDMNKFPTIKNYPAYIEGIIGRAKKVPPPENLEDRIIPRCDKCVHTWPDCGDTDFLGRCNKYKRDPPDGGFYG